MRRIVVLGTGFAGLHAIHALERALAGRRRVQLTVVTDQAHFLFTPLLPNVANGELSLKAITLPVAAEIDRDTELIVDRVTSIDLDQRVLHAESHTIPFDYLLAAPGAQTHWRGHPEWRPFSLTCKTSRDAALIRETMTRAYDQAANLSGEARARHLTFAFAGAGPTGVELAAELVAGLRRDIFPHADPALVDATRLILVDPGEELLPDLPAPLRHLAHDHLEHTNFELMLGHRVTHREADHFMLDDDLEVRCDHFFWCGGVTPSPILRDADFEHGDGGRVLVDHHLQARGHEGVFVIGDGALTPDEDPQTAQVAKQQGPVAAQNLVAALSGRAPKRFGLRHLGDMITLGRPKAGVSLMGVTLEGLPAYAMYRIAYAGLMPGPMKKLRIMTEWLEHDLESLLPGEPRGLLED